jgi:hypothetical protein
MRSGDEPGDAPSCPSEERIEHFSQEAVAVLIFNLFPVSGDDCIDTEVMEHTVGHSEGLMRRA